MMEKKQDEGLKTVLKLPETSDKDVDVETAINKNGFDDSERLTLKINVQEANKYQAKKSKKILNIAPKNLKKNKKKSLHFYEDEDDDDDWLSNEDMLRSLRELQINQNDASNADTTLINALNETERRQIMQSTNIEIIRHEENAGKQNALEQADTMLRKADLKRMTTKEFADEMKDAIYNPSRLRREALQDSIAKQMGIVGKIEKRSEGEVVEGVKKVKELSKNRQVPQLKMNDVKKVGEKNMSQLETAELILKKSGQTARLEEMKNETSSKPLIKSRKAPKKMKSGKTYSAEMKELLKESLKKNPKTR